MNYTFDIEIPDAVYARLERQAEASKITVQTVIKQVLERLLFYDTEETVPPLLRNELRAMALLSDESLRAVAIGKLTPAQQATLTRLTEASQFDALSEPDQILMRQLLAKRKEVALRRVHAALLLMDRGYDPGDPIA